MIGRWLLGGLSAFTLLALVCPSWAAPPNTVPPVPNIPRVQFPKFEGLPEELQLQLEELQQQLQRAFDPDGLQQELNRRAIRGNSTTMNWGGLRVKKVAAALQEKLGLPENEGLHIAAVDTNSVAGKAGLKVNDVLVKINNQPVPNDLTGFAKLVKDQKPAEAVDLVVVRSGKEETIKGVKMPAPAQANPNFGIRPNFGVRPGFLEFPDLLLPRFNINPNFPMFPFHQGEIHNLQVEMTVNGAKFSRKQTTEEFSGTYAKDELTITVKGKIENGLPRIGEITVQADKQTKTYTKLGDVPAQHRAVIRHHLLPASGNLLTFPFVPQFPGFDNQP